LDQGRENNFTHQTIPTSSHDLVFRGIHEATARWLAKHRGPVILSNQATDRIMTLYESCGFKTFKFAAPRSISCTGDRASTREVIATRGLSRA
jgi:hypothetical protein